MTAEKTKIKASYIIAFDGNKHRYLRDGELVYEGQNIVYVGKSYEGEVAKTIDAKGKIISPGFISTHAHLSESPMDRSFVEDVGKPQFYFSGLYEMLPTRGAAMDREMLQLCLEYSLAEILRSGTTTVVELGPFGEDLLPLQPRRLLQHQDGLAELLMAARLAELCPEEVVVWGVEPAVVTPGTELSTQVASRLDDLVDRVVEELQRWGIRPRPNMESRPEGPGL